MRIGVYGNYSYDFENDIVKGAGNVERVVDVSERDLLFLVNDLKHLLRFDTWKEFRGRDIFESTTNVYGLLGICSSFTLQADDNQQPYLVVQEEKIDFPFIQNEIRKFSQANEKLESILNEIEMIEVQSKSSTYTNKLNNGLQFNVTTTQKEHIEKKVVGKRHFQLVSENEINDFVALLNEGNKHISVHHFHKGGELSIDLKPKNLLGALYLELKKRYVSNAKIKRCLYWQCNEKFVAYKDNQKCCSTVCSGNVRRDKKRFLEYYDAGKEKRVKVWTENYGEAVTRKWIEDHLKQQNSI